MAISTGLTHADLGTITVFAGLPDDGRAAGQGAVLRQKGGQRDPSFRVKTGAGERLRPYQQLRVAHNQGKGGMAIKFVHQY